MCQMNIRPNKFSTSNQPPRSSSQGGFVLVIALIVLAAMTLAAAAMVRTVDTSTLLARNISFKRDAVNRNDLALEVAINAFRVGGNLDNLNVAIDKTAHHTDLNYFAVMLPTDTDGVPLVLKNAQTSAPFFLAATSDSPPLQGTLGPAEPAAIAAPNLHLGMTPIYVIERMCTALGVALPANCIVNGRAQAGGTQPNDKPGQLFPPLYRITARVTGPRNTVSYVQAIFGAG